jgi:hypothetical protein
MFKHDTTISKRDTGCAQACARLSKLSAESERLDELFLALESAKRATLALVGGAG